MEEFLEFLSVTLDLYYGHLETYDAIDWIVKNIPHNNGKVGVFGISYPGFFSTMAAASNHPALKAVSPQAPVTNWFIGDDFHHNGAFFVMDAFSFYVGGGFGLPAEIAGVAAESGLRRRWRRRGWQNEHP